MSTAPTTPAPETTGGLSEASRLANVFFAPSTTFTDLKRKPSWWAPWLLITAFSMLFVFAIQQKVGFAQTLENQMRSSPKSSEQYDKMTPEQRAGAATFTKIAFYSTPIFVLLFSVVIAGLLMATFNFGMGTEVPYRLALAITFYAGVPGILKSILAAVSLYAGADPEAFNPNNPAATNPGYFLSAAEHPVLSAGLAWFDIFGIWTVILLGIGFASVTKVKRGTAIWVVAGWYILIALISTGIAAARS